MDIKHDALCAEVRSWANATNQEYVARIIAAAYFELGGSELRLYPVSEPEATHKNMQNIFRWLDGCTELAMAKVKELAPAIIHALPAERRHYLLTPDSIAYRSSCANKECTEAVNAALLESPELEREVDEAIESLLALKKVVSKQRGLTNGHFQQSANRTAVTG